MGIPEKNKIRILVLPSWYPPAGGSFFRDHAETLSTEEFEVHVVVNRMMGITNTPLITLLKATGKKTTVENGVLVQRKGFIKLPLLEKTSVQLWIRSYICQVQQYLKEYGHPDVIIIHSAIWAGPVAVKLSEKFNIPAILFEHRSRFASDDHVTEKFFKNWYIKYLKCVFTRVWKIVVVSDSLRKRINQYIPDNEDKIITIPNIINTDFFTIPEKKSEDGKFIFLTIAMLEEVKGLRYLLEAFSLFSQKISSDTELRIAGKGSLEKELKHYSSSMGISGRVKFLGYLSRDDIRDELQQAHIFILPGIIEAFGVSLVEAMSSGLPVIATKSGGPGSIVTEDIGILVPVRDPEALANAMEQMIQNYSLYDRKKIRNYAVNNFSKHAVYLQWEKLIKETIYEQSRIVK